MIIPSKASTSEPVNILALNIQKRYKNNNIYNTKCLFLLTILAQRQARPQKLIINLENNNYISIRRA